MSVKRNFQDSLFRDIFKDPENQLKQYLAFHPEDTSVTVNDLRTVTLESVLVNGICNDLGFMVRDQLIILIEAQSTWSPNILIRQLMYYTRSLEEFLFDHGIDIYSSKAARIPKPELYVVYSGNKKDIPSSLSLAETFWDGDNSFLDLHVKIVTAEGDDIIGQYLRLVEGLKKAMERNDDISAAVNETIDECISKGILSDYLIKHRKEAVSYMLLFLNEEYLQRSHDNTVRDEGRELGREEGRLEGRAEGRAEALADAVALLAGSYLESEASLGAEDAVRKAADLLDPSRTLDTDSILSRILSDNKYL